MAGLLSAIKNETKKIGGNRGKIVFMKDGDKKRFRFLCDADDGMAITFHDSFEKSVNVVCQEHYGKSCPFCEDEELRTRQQYAWSVWDYDANEVKLFMFAVNNCSPVPQLVALYDEFGTITDRDFVIKCTGKQQNKQFTVIPMEKAKFRNTKVKAFSESAILKMLAKAYPADIDDDAEDEEEKKPKKKGGITKVKPVEDDWDEEQEEKEIDYSEMSAKELFKLCKEREIEVVPKKPAKYYINLLEEYDSAHDDWDEEDDEWEEDNE